MARAALRELSSRAMSLKSWLGLLLLAGTNVACGDDLAHRTLRLIEFRQRDSSSVALNEELVFYFSEDLDRTSITSDSLRFLDPEGAEVAGERVVRGSTLSFKPELPCASDLSDGGLRPGTSYRVVLGGFPRLDGIRSQAGELLSASLVLDFRTASIGSSPLFLDPFLGPFPLFPLGMRSLPIEIEQGFIVLEHREALDPSSVPACRFALSHYLPGADVPQLVPTQLHLIRNKRNQALLLLEPLGAGGIVQRLQPGRYYLEMPGRELRTLGGRVVEPGWKLLEFVVRRPRIEVDFGSGRGLASELPPGCDGTASWSEGGGGLRVRYPAAAGIGAEGPVELRQAPAASDLHSTRLTIPEDATVDLAAHVGPAVLRSQTSLDVRGRLTRTGQGLRHDPLVLDPLEEELERAALAPESAWAPLTPFLARMLDDSQSRAREREPWTVLIAGGDILVPEGGSIEVDGPLLLVAGGWIRVEGSVVARGDIWRSSGGGGGVVSHASNRPLPLLLDAPTTNPLRAPLVLGALTTALPWSPRDGDWKTQLSGLEGAGRIAVEFLQEAPGGQSRLLDDPGELVAGPVRVLVRLELGAGHGEPWEPPYLERLRLEAEPADPLATARY